MEKETVFNVTRLDGKDITDQDKINLKNTNFNNRFQKFDEEYFISFGTTDYKVIKTLIEKIKPKIFWYRGEEFYS